MRADVLIKAFEDVRLKLQIENKPLSGGWGSITNQDVFQMTIETARTKIWERSQYFRMFPGHPDNRIQVIDSEYNKKTNKGRVLLFLHEPVRTFVEEINKTRSEKRNNQTRESLEIQNLTYTETQNSFRVNRKTPEGKRTYLMGVDDRELFIAQTRTPVKNIQEAEKSLGSTIFLSEGKRQLRALSRQGEWFFVGTSSSTRDRIELLISKNSTFIKRNAAIGNEFGRRQGKPHTADELVVLPQKLTTGWDVRSRVYVRGKIRHADHPTVKYSQWTEVIQNSEAGTDDNRFSGSGSLWID